MKPAISIAINGGNVVVHFKQYSVELKPSAARELAKAIDAMAKQAEVQG